MRPRTPASRPQPITLLSRQNRTLWNPPAERLPDNPSGSGHGQVCRPADLSLDPSVAGAISCASQPQPVAKSYREGRC